MIKDSDNWLNFATTFECEKMDKKSKRFASVLPHSLTLDANYVTTYYAWQHYNTLFDEIKVVPPLEAISEKARAIFTTKIGTLQLPEGRFLALLRHKLMDIVYNNWDSKRFHVQLHSSGLDSRILSWTIKCLAEKYGKSWLGDVIFLCSKWEGSEFKKIMRYEGWSENQYRVVDEELPVDQYYAFSFLNFNHAWIENNGPAAIPVNLMWYLVERCQIRGIVPEHIQLWTSQWGNVIMETGSGIRGGQAIKNRFITEYLSTIGTSPKKGDEVIDIYSQADYIKVIVQFSIRLAKRLRPGLVRSMNRRLLEDFRNIHASGDRRQPIADWIMKKVIEDYERSWYGRNVAPNVSWKSTTKDAACWSRWTSASLCEYLLENGYRIKVRR